MTRTFFPLASFTLCLAMVAVGNALQDPTSSGAGQLEKQQNSQSANQDNSAISGDQVTKPAGAKTATVIGCLSGPDTYGHYKLDSMEYRMGVEVVGPNDLDKASGQKVKLTGAWVAATPEAGSTDKAAKKFQASAFDVLSENCTPPAETNPVSKQKQKKQK